MPRSCSRRWSPAPPSCWLSPPSSCGTARDRDVFTRSARLALTVLVPAILFTMLVGDELGVIEAKYQPMEIAAFCPCWPPTTGTAR
ncbi:MAG: hypothetical protein WAV12_03925 [Trebonia sp.]